RPASTSTKAMVAALSASGSAANTDSMAPGPTSFSRAIAFWVAALLGSFDDRISVTSRSARKFVKKLIQPFRRTPLRTHPARLRDQTMRGCRGSVRSRRRARSEEHTSELQSRRDLVCRLLLEKKKKKKRANKYSYTVNT